MSLAGNPYPPWLRLSSLCFRLLDGPNGANPGTLAELISDPELSFPGQFH
ncbi:uncharacterized protein P174DRAFT_446585 [Aspergillus novofumigatus IBT 16806]|uniref:Uncharacterized protein n=1 Tax=Aspergillus novofumigatus (strain IBT 16806) TaxID=1392255 RepID=A0A2I1BS35_ASPN1|nr:uncharacterized protein P174DRAFT_446585 [Aspergillus novofumigatus IBT 16806]PKX88199.1 hypothetical protein P174DRAFT_446585 [Aspergillus novofumigatus IBT 16806]